MILLCNFDILFLVQFNIFLTLLNPVNSYKIIIYIVQLDIKDCNDCMNDYSSKIPNLPGYTLK